MIPRISAALLSAALAFGAASGARAGDYWHAASIRSVQVLSNGSGFILTLASDSAQCGNTSSPKQYWMLDGQNGVTTAGVQANLATVLTAKATGKQVAIFFNDATTNCYFSNTRLQD